MKRMKAKMPEKVEGKPEQPPIEFGNPAKKLGFE